MTKHQTQAEPAAPAEPVTPAEVQPPEDPATRIAELEAALQEMKDKWLRSEAEMANLRARTKREVEDARLYAVQKFAKDVVEAAENLKRGIDKMCIRDRAIAMRVKLTHHITHHTGAFFKA